MNNKIFVLVFFLCSLSFKSIGILEAVQIKEFPIISPLYEAGMFSHFLTNLGALECYEQGIYRGCKVDYETRGLYYEPKLGNNWWLYYFDPIIVGSTKDSLIIKYTWQDCARLAYWAIDHISRQKACELIQKYIKVKPHLVAEINQFTNKHFKSKHIIAVHYRGTDKIASGEARFVSYETVLQAIVDHINEKQLTDYQVFVATDEVKFLEYMLDSFPNKVIFQEATRSTDNQAVHVQRTHPYQVGKEALFDSILLSKCDYLVRTESNLSLCSTYFNPNIPVRVLYGR